MRQSTLRIAWRNLSRNRKRTALAIAAIALGQFTLVFVNCMMAGMYADMLEAVTGPLVGHAQIHHPEWREEQALDLTIDDVSSARAEIARLPGVRRVSPRVYAPALAAPGAKSDSPATAEPAMLVGVDVGVESERNGLLGKLTPEELPSGREVVLGRVLARRLKLGPGDPIAVIGTDADGFPASDLFKVRAIMRSNASIVNRLGIVADIEVVQTFVELGDAAHELIIVGEDPHAAEKLARGIRGMPRLEGEVLDGLRGLAAPVLSLAFSPDGKRFVSGCGDNTVRVWDVAAGAEVLALTRHSASVTTVAFSPDGRSVASGDSDGTVKLWYAHNGELHQLPADSLDAAPEPPVPLRFTGHSAPVTSTAFDPQGLRLASASEDGAVKVWDVSTGAMLLGLAGDGGRVSSIAFGLEGKLLASAGDNGKVHLWDAATGDEVRTLVGHQAPISSIAFRPRSSELASGSHDGTIKVWNVDTGKEVSTLEGQKGVVATLAYDPDGDRLAAAGEDGIVRLWTASGRTLLPQAGSVAGGVRILAYSQDGLIAAAGESDTVELMDVSRMGEVLSWMKAVPMFEMFFNMKDRFDMIFVLILFVAAAAGIVNTMMMSTFERTREFGMLLSLGASPWRIVRMILYESIMLGLTGVAIGSALGTGVVLLTGHYGFDYGWFSGVTEQEFTIQGLSMTSVMYPMFELKQVLLGVYAVTITAVLAAVWPALIVTRLEPAEAIRS
ncbi:MAG: FtsX-like permease family protein [Planctomycetota bacterium]|jgi:WD40 repeat protein/cell division protein FtsX